MIDITTLKCEGHSSTGYSACHKYAKAIFHTLTWDFETKTNVPSVEAHCAIHAAGMRRRSWRPREADPFDDTVQQMLVAKVARIEAAKVRDDEFREEKRRKAAEARLERAQREWDTYHAEWELTLILDERPVWFESESPYTEVMVVVHQMGSDPESSWDVAKVSIDETVDEPAKIRVQAGSPFTCTPYAAGLLAEAINLVSEWVSEINDG